MHFPSCCRLSPWLFCQQGRLQRLLLVLLTRHCNFYFCCGSLYPVDPYAVSDGDYFTPAGDCYSVYPAAGGYAYDSIRICAFYDALQDQRAMQLAESLCGRDAVIDAMEGHLPEDKKVTFSEYPHGIAYIHETRAKVNALIASKL